MINVDGTPHLANKIKGLVFGATANETPSVPPEVAEFFFEQALEEANAASFAPPTVDSFGQALEEAALNKPEFSAKEKLLLREAEGYVTRLKLLLLILTALGCLGGAGLLVWALLENQETIAATALGGVVGALIQAVVGFSILGLVRDHFKIHAQLLAAIKRKQRD